MIHQRKKQKDKIRKIGVVFIVLLSLFAGGSYVYAKYYSQSAQAGIAIASGIYFTANYAVATNEDGEFFESIVKSDYQGSEFSFDFEVRNYENNLLFNESGVVIPYTLSFWLGEEPTDATYTIKWADQSKEIGVGKENKVEITGQSISGGSALSNHYTISIRPNGGSVAHKAVPVFVQVCTEAGSIVNRILKGKMILNNIARPESFIESQGFVVNKEAVSDEEKFKEIEKLSELTYEIRTVGEVLISDEVTEELKLSWDPSVFEIDLFDNAYLDWKERTSGATEPKTDASGWKYITVKVMPYSVENIGFFRGQEYTTKVTSMETLDNFIKAEKYQASSEETT